MTFTEASRCPNCTSSSPVTILTPVPWSVPWDLTLSGLVAMMSAFTIVGIPTNIMLIVVFWRRQRKRGHAAGLPNLFALILACLDLAICALCIPTLTVSLLGLVRSDLGCQVIVYLNYTSISMEIYLLLGVSLERYCAVCKPFFRWSLLQAMMYIAFGVGLICILSGVIFTTVVFNPDSLVFCYRQPSLGTDVLDWANVCLWFLIVLAMAALYTLTLVRVLGRARRWSPSPEVMAINAIDSTKSSRRMPSSSFPPAAASPITSQDRQRRVSVVSRPRRGSVAAGSLLSSQRITVLFVALTALLVLSWTPFWWCMFQEEERALILRNLIYLNNCTNALVFCTNPTLRREMMDLLKQIFCRRARKVSDTAR